MKAIFKISTIGILLLAMGSNTPQAANHTDNRTDKTTNIDHIFERLKLALGDKEDSLHAKGYCMRKIAVADLTRFEFSACWLQMRKSPKKSACV